MCFMCEMREKQVNKESETISLTEVMSDFSDRIEELEKQLKHLIPYSRKELIDRLNSFKSLQDNYINVLSERIEQLEKKAILKPDYNPDEVALNTAPIAKEGTFEWAIINMKYGKKVRREGNEFTYYFTTIGSLMQIHVDGDDLYEDKLDELDIDSEDLIATDWKIV